MKYTEKNLFLYMQNKTETTLFYPLSYQCILWEVFVMLTSCRWHFSTAQPIEYGKHHSILALTTKVVFVFITL